MCLSIKRVLASPMFMQLCARTTSSRVSCDVTIEIWVKWNIHGTVQIALWLMLVLVPHPKIDKQLKLKSKPQFLFWLKHRCKMQGQLVCHASSCTMWRYIRLPLRSSVICSCIAIIKGIAVLTLYTLKLAFYHEL